MGHDSERAALIYRARTPHIVKDAPSGSRPCWQKRRHDTPWPPGSGGWHTCRMLALLAALVAGLLGIAGTLAAVLVTSRGARSQWRKDTQLKVSTEVLSALQKRVSQINHLAYLDDKEGDEFKKAWSAHAASAVKWNNARHAVLFISPAEVVALLQSLDEQVDWLTGRAMAKQWILVGFRKEREKLGQLAANYLDAMRAETGWQPLRLKSLWMWDQTEEPSSVDPQT
jgi:hypothetical protein